MCGPYWSQWSKVELDSMHGIEPEDYDKDEEEVDGDFEEDKEDEEESYGCSARSPCSNCMDCLGMSWRDFM